ncbi:MAG: hypothetical protein WCD54_28965 [Pseudolabrys sp.]
MPRDGAIIFADLIGKLDVLYVHCPKCSRAGRYRVQHLIEERGGNAKLIDWLDESPPTTRPLRCSIFVRVGFD